MVAEYEPTASLWVQWDEGSYMGSPPIDEALMELIGKLTPHHKVTILLGSEFSQQDITQRLATAGILLSKVEFMNAWAMGAITDTAPIWLEVTPGGSLAMVDFAWSNYGIRKPGHPKALKTDVFDVQMAQRLAIPVRGNSKLVIEGGALDHNGKGTILFSEQWMSQRNPDWSKAAVAQELSKHMGVTHILWLQKGPVEDDFQQKFPGNIYPFGTGGHVDEFCRFANDSTLLLAAVDEAERAKGPLYEENYQRMEANARALEGAVDQDGRPLKVLRVPSPELIVKEIPYEEVHPGDLAWFPGLEEGESLNLLLATSYLNFILTDKIVVYPQYGEALKTNSARQKDREVKRIFEQVFPDKELIPFNPIAFNYQGGGLHGYSYNQPEKP